MDIPLRVLIIEDSGSDVALEVRALKAAGYQLTYAVAETAAEMKAALAEQTFDIIISDHGLPQFDAPGALAVLKQSGLDIPFIVVSGSIGEEIAVALMKAGAHDYVMKDRLARLVPAVQKELREAESRREHKQAEEELKKREKLLQKIFDVLPVGLWFADKDGMLLRGNPAGVKIWGAEPKVGPSEYGIFRARRLPSGEKIAPEDWALAHTVRKKVTVLDELLEIDAFDGKKKVILNYTAPVLDDQGAIQGAIVVNLDITRIKEAEEQLQQTLDSLRKAIGTTIQVMVSAVEVRDPYTAGHQIRSADLSRAIATEMGLPQEKIDGVRMAGTIHDIGKLSVPAEILSKPTKLSDIELSLIKEHARRGFEMLKDVESPWPLAEIVYQHHERMDGSGYPRNLKGDDILIEARILAVADVVEAMASHRPYRPGLGIDAALSEIEKNSGIFYDNAVADTCLRLFREKGFQLTGT